MHSLPSYFFCGSCCWHSRDAAEHAHPINCVLFYKQNGSAYRLQYVDSIGLRPTVRSFAGCGTWTDPTAVVSGSPHKNEATHPFVVTAISKWHGGGYSLFD